MSPDPATDFAALVRALQSSLTGTVADIRPGQLRLRLEQHLADDAQRLRPLVHQVVVAAEEHLPANLTRIAPLSVHSLQRLSGELAEARGWAPETARRATRIWASALGYDDVAAAPWPEPEEPEPAPQDPARGAVTERSPSRRPEGDRPKEVTDSTPAPPGRQRWRRR